ncbi:DUF3891 family protein [Zobellia russellii]|uniref:DUF3891 family protein n=1 Tax=Zobellia russellii TaxID=248907 RepID=UPI001BFF6CE2|nr:DUF3891 family protein [Zobellia russellii]MBT9188298.1 DUF3891 family protein [Zobellia russellii]
MIVKHTLTGWEIISQYAHGLLAGKIASQLETSLTQSFWVDALTAIVEHDDYLLNFEEHNYLTQNGSPKDFTMDTNSPSDALEHAKRVFENSMQKSQLIALLIGRHLSFLYESLAGDYEPLKQFLSEIDSKRSTQRKLYAISKKTEDELYNILLFSDRCSLILSQDKIPEVGRKVEINKTINNERYYLRQKEDNSITVEPWPFKSDFFKVHSEYKVLDTPVYKDNNHLKKVLAEADFKMRTYIFKK